MARGRALDAAAFVRERRRDVIASLCGDLVPFEETPTALPTQVAGPTTTTPGTGSSTGTGGDAAPPGQPSLPEAPVGPPLLPPQPPASGTTPGD